MPMPQTDKTKKISEAMEQILSRLVDDASVLVVAKQVAWRDTFTAYTLSAPSGEADYFRTSKNTLHHLCQVRGWLTKTEVGKKGRMWIHYRLTEAGKVARNQLQADE